MVLIIYPCNNPFKTVKITCTTLLDVFAQLRKSLLPFPCPHTCISVVPTEQISLKFDTQGFYENAFGKSQFGYNGTKILGTLKISVHIIVSGHIKLP